MAFPQHTPADRIMALFQYRCRVQLFQLTTQMLDRVWSERAIGQAADIDRLRHEERQALRRAFQRSRRDDAKVRQLFVDAARAAYARLALHAAAGAVVLVIAYAASRIVRATS